MSRYFERLWFQPVSLKSKLSGQSIPDDAKVASIMTNMVSSMSGTFESVAVFVDEMTAFKAESSTTKLGSRNSVLESKKYWLPRNIFLVFW